MLGVAVPVIGELGATLLVAMLAAAGALALRRQVGV